MAELTRTIGIKIRTEAEGETDALDRAEQEIRDLQGAAQGAETPVEELGEAMGELGEAADKATPAIAGVGEKTEEVGKAASRSQDPRRLLKGDLRDIAEGADVAGIALDKFIKVMVGFTVAKAAIDTLDQLKEKLNEVEQKLGGTGDSFDTFAGIALMPKKSIEELVTALTDFDLYLDNHSGKLEEQKQKHEEVREKFLAWRDAHVEVKEAVDESSAAHDKLATAAEQAAERAAKAQQAVADAWQKHLDQSREESARRTEEELAQVAKLKEEQAAAAAAVVEQVKARWDEFFANNPAQKWLDDLNAKLEETRVKGEAAAAAVGSVVAAASEGFPFKPGTPRYEPEGGFLTPSGGPLRPA